MKKYLLITFSVILIFALISCGDEEQEEKQDIEKQGEVAYTPDKDSEIQRYNLERQRQLRNSDVPCDTLDLVEYVLDNYPEGTYVVYFDENLMYNVPHYAVLYDKKKEGNYVYGVIARSKPGERYIEPDNIVGYDESFIDLDSTELGTAFFYLVLFECVNDQFERVWEAPIPSHGGFNTFTLEKWNYNGTPYIRVNFHYARGIGHIDYNYFLVDGIRKQPHLLMTYEGINFKRIKANVNDDEFPDYYEFLYYDLGDRVYAADSVAFIWDTKDSLYVNTRNGTQTRPY